MHTTKRRQSIFAVLMVLILSALGGGGTSAVARATASNEAPQHQVDPQNQRAINFRNTFGLQSDAAYVSRSYLDPTGFPDMTFGIPLNDAEAADMNHRLAVQETTRSVRTLAKSIPESGGTYLDQHAGGIPVFLVVGDPRNLVARIDASFASLSDYRVEQVRYTLSDLARARDALISDTKSLRENGVDIGSVGYDTVTNSVIVGVRGLTDNGTKSLIDRYGPIVTTREEPTHELDSCLSRIECPPMKGGIKIYKTTNTADICTSGFIVKLTGTSTLRVLTAGHCIEETGGLGVGWSHHGSQFGTAQTETYGLYSNADAGLISLSLAAPRNLFYASSETDIRSVDGWYTNAEQDIGTTLCRSGKTSGYWCGTIVHTDLRLDVDGKDIDHQWEVNFDAIPGDSGGPYFLGPWAFGIHSDSTSADPPGGLAWYSPIDWVRSKLSSYGDPIDLCVTSSC